METRPTSYLATYVNPAKILLPRSLILPLIESVFNRPDHINLLPAAHEKSSSIGHRPAHER